MHGDEDASFRVDELLVPLDQPVEPPDQLVAPTGHVNTHGFVFWPNGGLLVCSPQVRGDVSLGGGEPPPGDGDLSSLATVKSLLRAQIAQMEADPGLASTDIVPMSADHATIVEQKLLRSLERVRSIKAGGTVDPT